MIIVKVVSANIIAGWIDYKSLCWIVLNSSSIVLIYLMEAEVPDIKDSESNPCERNLDVERQKLIEENKNLQTRNKNLQTRRDFLRRVIDEYWPKYQKLKEEKRLLIKVLYQALENADNLKTLQTSILIAAKRYENPSQFPKKKRSHCSECRAELTTVIEVDTCNTCYYAKLKSNEGKV